MDLYLEDHNAAHRKEILRLAKLNNDKADDLILR